MKLLSNKNNLNPLIPLLYLDTSVLPKEPVLQLHCDWQRRKLKFGEFPLKHLETQILIFFFISGFKIGEISGNANCQQNLKQRKLKEKLTHYPWLLISFYFLKSQKHGKYGSCSTETRSCSSTLSWRSEFCGTTITLY